MAAGITRSAARQRWLLFGVTLALAGASGVGMAEDNASPPTAPATPQNAPGSILAFAETHPGCLEWSDGCFVCRRQSNAAPPACSTAGIACEAQPLACREPAGAR